MKSIPVAMAWELFDRGRWSLPAAALGALALPMFLLAALGHDGGVDPHDKSMLIMQLVMVQLNIVLFGFALAADGWRMSRHYVYPASTATLVTWRMLPAMIAMAVETVAWTAILNAVFHLHWPLWGPALLSAATVAAVTAAVWLTEKSRWIVMALTVAGAVPCLWLKSRFGGMFSDPVHSWDEVTPAEIFMMLAFAGLAYWVAVVGVARNRRGEAPFSVGFVAWLTRVLDGAADERPAFRTPRHAQFWYEWRNGWMMPTVVISGMVVGLAIWCFASRDPQDLMDGLWVGSRIMLGVALISGFLMGNTGVPNDIMMSQFFATRPMTTTDLSRTMLRAAGSSLLLAWIVWAAVVLLMYGVLAVLGVAPSRSFPEFMDWREIPASFLGSWILLAGWISIAITGRPTLIFRVLICLIVGFIGLEMTAKFVLSHEAQGQLMHGLMAGVGIGLLLGAGWALIASLRRGLVEATAVWAAHAIWAALIVGGALLFSHDASASSSFYALALGLSALIIAPLWTAPLAMAWNRHR